MRAGLVTVSGGNHAIALAKVAGTLGIDALVLMPKVTPRFNIDLTEKYGATCRTLRGRGGSFSRRPRNMAGPECCSFIPMTIRRSSPGMAPSVWNSLEDFPDLTHVFMSIGGGGFIAGSAAALKAKVPSHRRLRRRDDRRANDDGGPESGRARYHPRHLHRPNAGRAVCYRTHACRPRKQFVERVIVVDDGRSSNDLAWLLQTEKVLCEPAAACVLTAAQTICDTLPADAVIGLVLCGSNVALEDLDRWRQQFAA